MSNVNNEVFFIHAPGIDHAAVVKELRAHAAKRAFLPQPAAALGRARMHEERQALLDAIDELKKSMRVYGLVDSHRKGWFGRLERFIKRSIRKLFLRHILQQHRVHLKLVKFLGLLMEHLENEDRVMRLGLDYLEQQRPSAATEPQNIRKTGMRTLSFDEDVPQRPQEVAA